jgi:FixJ family two-component response regulator
MAKPSSCVAIVDDDASVRKALARLLNAFAISTEAFGSGQEFLDSLTADQPGCLVIDQHMPEMTGLELQAQLRRIGRNIPTIIITAHDQPGLRERCQSAGARAYLLKPLNQTYFLAAINEAIGTR